MTEKLIIREKKHRRASQQNGLTEEDEAESQTSRTTNLSGDLDTAVPVMSSRGTQNRRTHTESVKTIVNSPPRYRPPREMTALEMCIEDDAQDWVPLEDSDSEDEHEHQENRASIGAAAFFLESALAAAAVVKMSRNSESQGGAGVSSFSTGTPRSFGGAKNSNEDDESCNFYDSFEVEMEDEARSKGSTGSPSATSKKEGEYGRLSRSSRTRLIVSCTVFTAMMVVSMLVLLVLSHQRLGIVRKPEPITNHVLDSDTTVERGNPAAIPRESNRHSQRSKLSLSEPSARPTLETAPSNTMDSFFIFENTTKLSLSESLERLWKTKPVTSSLPPQDQFADAPAKPQQEEIPKPTADNLPPLKDEYSSAKSSGSDDTATKKEAVTAPSAPNEEKVQFFEELDVLNSLLRQRFGPFLQKIHNYLNIKAAQLREHRAKRQQHRRTIATHCQSGRHASWKRCSATTKTNNQQNHHGNAVFKWLKESLRLKSFGREAS